MIKAGDLARGLREAFEPGVRLWGNHTVEEIASSIEASEARTGTLAEALGDALNALQPISGCAASAASIAGMIRTALTADARAAAAKLRELRAEVERLRAKLELATPVLVEAAVREIPASPPLTEEEMAEWRRSHERSADRGEAV